MVYAKLKGVIVPLITPFKSDYSIDVEGLKWLVTYLIENGVNGIFVNSSVGEFASLTLDEMKMLGKIVLDTANNKVPIFVGISTNFTEESISLGKEFRDMGADFLVVMAPYFFKVSERELLRHFSLIAEKLDSPIIIYNIPIYTGINIPISVYKTLVSQYSNVVGTKVTIDSLIYLKKLVRELKEIRKDFAIFTGFDDYLLPLLSMGGNGGVMGLANVLPKLHLEIYRNWERGKIDNINWIKLLELTEIYNYCNSYTASIKAAMRALGMPIMNVTRPPLDICNEELVRKKVNEFKNWLLL